MKIKAFIIMYNRLTWPKAMAEFLTATGCEVILIDNKSTYMPLLEWYQTCPYQVIRCKENYGHQVLWTAGIIDTFEDQYYIVTDPDLDLSGIPHNYIEVLKKALDNAHPDICKAGFSLSLSDLPANELTQEVIEWETKFWQTPIDTNGFYKSDIDTTFALYDRKRQNWGTLPNTPFFWALRAPRPYTARHLPWYLTKQAVEENPEEKYYLDHTGTYWAQKFKEAFE